VRSCLYEGTVRHRRLGAVPDEFSRRLFMSYLDLDELPGLLDASRLWSARGPAPAWFRRADYFGDPALPLKEAVGRLVAERTGTRSDGPVALLTHVRQFGHCFNPVSFYYCLDAPGERLTAVVAEVTNTPWRERHAYVMPAADVRDHGSASVVRGQFDKRLHVSPLMSMELGYNWRLTVPAQRLAVHIEARRQDDGAVVFDATLALRRREIDARSLRSVLLRYPLLSLRLQARIYTHALRLRVRGARWHAHPDRAPAAA
jgi:DUF1365 family protein